MAEPREQRTLAEVLKISFDAMSPSERKVARALIADYPVAGLEPVQRLADRAGVSAPTVLRMLAKIDIRSYPQMQEILRKEISQRNSSPMDQYSAIRRDSSADHPTSLAAEVFETGLRSSFSGLPIAEFDRIVSILADPRRRIWTVGGRYSSLLADYLTLHLRLLRPGVRAVGRGESDKSLALLDLGSNDVVVAFDYRRYQESTVTFCAQAKANRSSIVLFTDPWLSPAAKHADHLLSASVEAPSPFDSLVPSMALVEAVLAGVVETLGSEPLGRIQAFDALE